MARFELDVTGLRIWQQRRCSMFSHAWRRGKPQGSGFEWQYRHSEMHRTTIQSLAGLMPMRHHSIVVQRLEFRDSSLVWQFSTMPSSKLRRHSVYVVVKRHKTSPQSLRLTYVQRLGIQVSDAKVCELCLPGIGNEDMFCPESHRHIHEMEGRAGYLILISSEAPLLRLSPYRKGFSHHLLKLYSSDPSMVMRN